MIALLPSAAFLLLLSSAAAAAAAPCDERTELCMLYNAVDTDRDGLLNAGEIAKWAQSNGATVGNASSSSAELLTFRDVYNAAPETLRAPIVTGTVPQEVHSSLVNNTQLSVVWVTGQPTASSTIEFGLHPTALTSSIHGTTRTYTDGGWVGVIHEVHLPVMTPNTRFYYHVGDAIGGWSAVYSLKTPPVVGELVTADRPLLIATYGDMGTFIPLGYKVCELMLNDSRILPLDLIVHQGDIAYASTAVTVEGEMEEEAAAAASVGEGGDGEQEWVWDLFFEQIEPLAAHIPYVAGVGNHEKFYNYSSYLTRFSNPAPWGGTGSQPDKAVFWFGFDYSLVHFTMMSTEHDYAPGSPQWQWLEADLQRAAANRGTVPWVILVGHRPMYCSDKSEKDEHWPGAVFQQQIEPLMARYGVDMYLSGHMHMYERVHAVMNGTVVQKGASVYHKPGAPVHVVQGNAGVFEDVAFIDPQPAWSYTRKSRIGYGRMQVHNASHLLYEARELETGDNMDAFWIVK